MADMKDMCRRLGDIGEYYAQGLFAEPDAEPFVRYSLALRSYYENRALPAYNGEALYPCGAVDDPAMCVQHDYAHAIKADIDRLAKKDTEAAEAVRAEMAKYTSMVPWEHAVGGNMWTHSHPHFGRIVREGLDSYARRIEAVSDPTIRRGLTDVIAGIRAFHARALDMLRNYPEAAELCAALEKVPFSPAETLYEGLVCWNFIYYMDGCDNIGLMDADLMHLYKGEDVTDVLRCFFRNVDANNGWSGSIGPNYNELTIQILKACAGMRRPSIELRVTPEMPAEVWAAAIDAILAGGGSPCLYNEAGYQNSLAKIFPDIPKEDLMRFSGGGCTETMLSGISNVGSLDAGINVALIFDMFMRNNLPGADTFEEFYNGFIAECNDITLRVLDSVSESQKLRAKYRPHPMRTLLIDDCIAKEKDYNDGGARYRWSVINLAGLVNVIDSMLTIRKVIFEDRAMDGAGLIDFIDNGGLLLDYPDVPRHGTDSEAANEMAAKLTADVCRVFNEKTPYSGGKFLASSIQFTTYIDAGKNVGATPDGRHAGDSLCDCIGAIHGNDKNGVTALLNSACALCCTEMAGTPVMNIKLDANQSAKTLKPLVNAYFRSGGMQLQVTCVRKEDLLDARVHPEKYPNLIVRIGGYSEYFTRLSPELQQTVIDRTVYGM